MIKKSKNYISMNNKELLNLVSIRNLKLPISIKNELNSLGNDFKIKYSRKYVIDELEKLDEIKNKKRNLFWIIIGVLVSLLIFLYPFIYKLLKPLISIFKN